MIRVIGTATLRVDFDFNIDITKEKWAKMKRLEREELIDEFIGMSEMESAVMQDCDIDDVEEVVEE